MFSIRYMSFTMLIHSSIVGGSGCSQCLVRAFLPAFVKTPNKYLSVRLTCESEIPKHKVENCIGRLVLKRPLSIL